MILEGKASIVAGIMRRTATQDKISGKKRETIDKAADYFINNKSYMQYSQYLSLGLPIATGVIEGACRHLVQDRFEVSGAPWGLDVLKLRSIYQSGDWDEYWEFHITQDQILGTWTHQLKKHFYTLVYVVLFYRFS